MAKRLYSAEEAERKFGSLPQAVKDLLYSFEMTSLITKVGEKHGLHIDQMDALNTEAAQVMLGFTETSEFPEILMEDLSIDQAKADAIAKDIDVTLFARVRAALSQPSAMGETNTTSLPQSVPAEAAAPKPTPVTPAVPAVPAVPTVDMHPADLMLTQKTVVAPPMAPTPASPAPSTPTPKPGAQATMPPKPQEYKADPYREPTI